jgi:lipopolysaccharide/colanic/teichoic acid biosynthesis glycosyltransferase
VAKRAVDITAGSVLALVSLPLILLLAILSAVSFQAWPFFLHDRVGRGGRTFRFPKLRSLPKSTPAYATKYDLITHPTSRFGQWLRRRHLDELPQLLLVPVGRMSLVGPRPEMPALHAAQSEPLATARLAVRPGCTGLWQIGADCHRLIHECPEYDLFYLQHAGARLDLWVLWRSVLIVMGGAPMIRLDDVPQWALRTRRTGPAFAEPSPAGLVACGPVRTPSELGVASGELV